MWPCWIPFSGVDLLLSTHFSPSANNTRSVQVYWCPPRGNTYSVRSCFQRVCGLRILLKNESDGCSSSMLHVGGGIPRITKQCADVQAVCEQAGEAMTPLDSVHGSNVISKSLAILQNCIPFLPPSPLLLFALTDPSPSCLIHLLRAPVRGGRLGRRWGEEGGGRGTVVRKISAPELSVATRSVCRQQSWSHTWGGKLSSRSTNSLGKGEQGAHEES